MRRAVASWMRQARRARSDADRAARVGDDAGPVRRGGAHRSGGRMRGATAATAHKSCARLLLPSANDTESALLQRIEQRIEGELDISLPAEEAAASAPAPGKQYVRKAGGGTDRTRGGRAGSGLRCDITPGRAGCGTRRARRSSTHTRTRTAICDAFGAAQRRLGRAQSGERTGRRTLAQCGSGAPDVADGAGEGPRAQSHRRGDAGERGRPRGGGQHAGSCTRLAPLAGGAL